MNQYESLSRLAEIIDTKYRHKYYQHTCDLYEKYLALSTGVGVERYLRKFSSRESDQAFNERLNVTIDICKSVVKNLCHVFYRVARSTGIKIDVDAGAKSEEFNKILKSYGRFGLSGYMGKRFTDFNKIDPNGWLVVDSEGTDGSTYIQPYPVEYYSPDVVDYRYKLDVLEYLAVKQQFEKINKRGEIQEVSDYTIYTTDGAVKFIARPDIENAPPMISTQTYYSGKFIGFHHETVKYRDEKGMEQEKLVAEVYELMIPEPYGLEYTPAIPAGYIPDELTRGETFVNFFDNAVPYLEKLIKVNSEADISSCKHAFPQKIQFVKECPNKLSGCEQNGQGVYIYEGKVCPICHGNGFIEAHSSGMDVIYMPLTEETKDWNLDNMVKYVSVPIETLKYQDEKIQSLIEMCKRVVYNTDIFSRQEIAETATSKVIEVENMYDTIYIFAVHFGDSYRWQYEVISDLTTIPAEVFVSVSKDFKLLTKAQLIEMLEAASRAGASPQILSAINDELAYAFFGDSDDLLYYRQAQKLIPFSNKSKEEQAITLAALPNDNVYKVAYLFGEEIIKELEQTTNDFFLLNDESKKKLFDEKVAEIAATMTTAMPQFNWDENTEE